MAAGDFTASAITQNLVRAEAAWPTAPKRAYSKAAASLGTLQGVMIEGSDIPIREVVNGSNVCEYTVTWTSACDDTVAACEADVCDITVPGDRAESESKDYSIDQCVERTFQVSTVDGACNTSTFQDQFQKLLWAKMFNAEVEMDQAIIAVLLANTQAVDGLPGHWDQTGTGNVEIPASSFNSSMAADLSLLGIHNDLMDSYVLDGGKLYRPLFNANVDSSNPQNTDLQRFDSVLGNVYFDVKNLPVIAADTSYLVEHDAVKFVSHYFNTPEKLGRSPQGDGFNIPIQSSVESVFTPGLMYDMRTKITCVDNGGEAHYVYDYAIRVKYDTLLKPVQCADGQTGIIGLECV